MQFLTIVMGSCGTSVERLIVLLLVMVWNASRYSLLWLLFSYYKTVVSLI